MFQINFVNKDREVQKDLIYKKNEHITEIETYYKLSKKIYMLIFV